MPRPAGWRPPGSPESLPFPAVSLDSVTALFSNVWSIFLIVLFFGGSIFVHELGHFLAARRRGLKVARFSIGFGPKICAWTGKDGVEYRLSWLPLGGYVALPQLADMREIEGGDTGDTEPLPAVSYSSKFIVFVAGAVFNVLFAFVLATVLWVIGQPLSNDAATTRVGHVSATLPGTTIPSPAMEGGIKVGDTVRAIDGTPVKDWSAFKQALIMSAGRTPDGRPQTVFTVERDGRNLDLTLYPRLSSDESLRMVGISPYYDLAVQEITPDSLGAAAGFKVGDEIVSVEGTSVHNAAVLSEVLTRQPASPAKVTVKRDGKTVELTVPARPEGTGSIIPGVGFTVGYQLVHVSPITQISEMVVTTFRTLGSLLNPRSDIGLSKVSGPVGIVYIFYGAAGAGIAAVLWFTILININLAIFNLLPVPVLDGGHILFATIAKLRGRALPRNFIMSAQQVFIVLLFSMIIYVSFFDVRRWWGDVKANQEAAAPAKAAK
jgi:regulator of sigma E protease